MNILFEMTFQEIYQNNNENLELALIKLKEQGSDQIDTVKILMKMINLSLSDADTIVLNSTAWKEEKDYTEKLRDNFFGLSND